MWGRVRRRTLLTEGSQSCEHPGESSKANGERREDGAHEGDDGVLGDSGRKKV